MGGGKGTIAVTPRSLSRSGHACLDAFTAAGYEVAFPAPGRQPSEDELLAALPNCVGILAGVEPISARVLEAATKLKAIGRNGVGVDNIDLAAARRLGIAICPAAGANARGVAELTMGLILALARSIPFSDASLKGEDWRRRKGCELVGRSLGLIGCGQIGQIVARLALAFGMEVLASDPYPDGEFAPAGDFAYASLEDLLATADVVSLHCPAPDDGRAVIDTAALAWMRDGAYLVNTARGSLLDDDAVLAALESGRLAGVAVDAFDPEPPTDWRLAQHPLAIATPHIGGFTVESIDRAASVAIEKMLAVLDGA